MNQRLKKKLAYMVASYMFNRETDSVMDILQGAGVNVDFEEADEITGLIGDLFDRFDDLSDGWEDAIGKGANDK
jgi:hypothetical protein